MIDKYFQCFKIVFFINPNSVIQPLQYSLLIFEIIKQGYKPFTDTKKRASLHLSGARTPANTIYSF